MSRENLFPSYNRREFIAGSTFLSLVLPVLMGESVNFLIKKTALDYLRKNYPSWQGLAAWYSTKKEECLGCREDLIMANGKELRDHGVCTLACNKIPLNRVVLVLNQENDVTVIAQVTDRGEQLEKERLADLNVGLRNALRIDPNQGVALVEIIELPCQELLQTIT